MDAEFLAALGLPATTTRDEALAVIKDLMAKISDQADLEARIGYLEQFRGIEHGRDGFATAVTQYMGEKNVDRVAAIKHLQKAKPELYMASRRA